MDRMTLVFAFCVIGMVIISLYENAKGVVPNGLEIDTKMFRMSPTFLVLSLLIIGATAALYIVFW